MAEASPAAVRQAARQGTIAGQTSGLAPGYVQGNLVILPLDWARDFLAFCRANPKPCPLVAVGAPGDPGLAAAGQDIDIRTDLPSYRVFHDGVLVEEATDVTALWQDDFVSVLIGCSFSFEGALLKAGLGVRHIEMHSNVPMYRTNIDCVPAGRFSGKMVASMRPFPPRDAIQAIEITAAVPQVHGSPIHFGDPKAIGIEDVARPDYGDPVPVKPGEVPVFWACGVTPQVALAQARPPIAITHSPGCMLVTDVTDADLLSGRFQLTLPPALA
jgi:uncharacterized protein YcsI (UPF0317 family)